MKVTKDLRKEINAAVRENVRGACPGSRVGFRLKADGSTSCNALLWPEDSDLFDNPPFADICEIEEDPANPGCAELDLYVETGTGWNRELETNVGILIRDGRVIASHDTGGKLSAMKPALGFPVVPWDWS